MSQIINSGLAQKVYVINDEFTDGTTIGTASLSSSSASAVSLIAAGATGIFNNIASLTITNESSTATIVTLSDNGSGGNTYKFAIAANGGISYNPAIPLPQRHSGGGLERF